MTIGCFTILSSTNRGAQGGKVRVFKHHKLVITKAWYSIAHMLQIKAEIAQTLQAAQLKRIA